MSNVTHRQLLGEMGETFKNWADVYFSPESGRLNEKFVREEAQEDCLKKNNLKWSANKWGKAIKAWCKFYNYELNPTDMRNSGKRIIEKQNDGGTKEMYYIRTNQLQLHLDAPKTDESTKMPF